MIVCMCDTNPACLFGRTKLHLAKTGATMLQIFCGMILMLALMTYNAYLFVTVIIGLLYTFADLHLYASNQVHKKCRLLL